MTAEEPVLIDSLGPFGSRANTLGSTGVGSVDTGERWCSNGDLGSVHACVLAFLENHFQVALYVSARACHAQQTATRLPAVPATARFDKNLWLIGHMLVAVHAGAQHHDTRTSHQTVDTGFTQKLKAVDNNKNTNSQARSGPLTTSLECQARLAGCGKYCIACGWLNPTP